MPAKGKGKRSQRYPAKNRGVMGNGKMQSGGGSSGKSKGSMGMTTGHSRGSKRSYS